MPSAPYLTNKELVKKSQKKKKTKKMSNHCPSVASQYHRADYKRKKHRSDHQKKEKSASAYL